MKCSNKNCKHKDLKEDDFYFQTGRNEKRKICKYCMIEDATKRVNEKKREKELYVFI